MKQIGILLMVLFASNLLGQTNWYVDYQNGTNSNNGTSSTTPVKTVDYLTSNGLIQPKDTVFIMGQYNNPSYDPDFSYGGNSDRNNPHIWHAENTIKLNGLNGSQNGYITFMPFDSTTVLKGDGANIFRITNCSYLRIEGLEIYGEVENIPLSTAEGLITDGLQFLYLDPNTADPKHPALNDVLFRVTVGTPISVIESTTFPVLGSVTRPSYIDTRGLYVSGSNHIEIINNIIHHTPGGGLRIAKSSYVNIECNEIHDCSRRSYSGTHALVVTKTKQGVADTTDDDTYSISIKRNLIHHNYNEIFSWAPTKSIINPRIDEGKGISLQRNNLSGWKNGNKRILVENNLCYWNGFSGVHSNDGYHMDFINNTCYMNSYTNTVTYANETQKGNNIGISTSDGGDIKIINNISVVDVDWGGLAISSNGNTQDLIVRNNLIYGVNGTVSEDPDIVATQLIIDNPQFVNPSAFDFHLEEDSPAVDTADTQYAPANDFYNNLRDEHPDLGAVEYNMVINTSEGHSSHFKVYPNPFTDRIIIEQPLEKSEIAFYNLFGQNLTRHIQVIRNSQNTEVITADLPDGIYLIKTKNSVYKVSKLLSIR